MAGPYPLLPSQGLNTHGLFFNLTLDQTDNDFGEQDRSSDLKGCVCVRKTERTNTDGKLQTYTMQETNVLHINILILMFKVYVVRKKIYIAEHVFKVAFIYFYIL